jgi:hypothetical protein
VNDNLDTLTDAQLNECFAVEVAELAGLHWSEVSERLSCKDSSGLPSKVPDFSTDANAVLPWLEKHYHADIGCAKDAGWWVLISLDGWESVVKAEAPTFARAACIALIRANRKLK